MLRTNRCLGKICSLTQPTCCMLLTHNWLYLVKVNHHFWSTKPVVQDDWVLNLESSIRSQTTSYLESSIRAQIKFKIDGPLEKVATFSLHNSKIISSFYSNHIKIEDRNPYQLTIKDIPFNSLETRIKYQQTSHWKR